jgi:hypothetical protein
LKYEILLIYFFFWKINLKIEPIDIYKFIEKNLRKKIYSDLLILFAYILDYFHNKSFNILALNNYIKWNNTDHLNSLIYL